MCLINVLINSLKMATPQEKAQCVSRFKKSNVQTQRKYRTKYGTDPTSRPLIHR